MNTENLDNISFGDDSLSKKYSVGCYPVKMQMAKTSSYNLANTYWYGHCGDLDPSLANYGNDFVYKIEPAAQGTDQYTYGGYTMYE